MHATDTAGLPSGLTPVGANQHGVRDHNERLILSMIQRFGPMPGAEIAKRSGLSPQTASVILRALEADGFVQKGEPQRGRVGKPSIPMQLTQNAAFAVGLKIGRRTADFVLTDIHGRVRMERKAQYAYPKHTTILTFLETALGEAMTMLGPKDAARVSGIGVATPFEIWNWHETIGAPQDDLDRWRGFDLAQAISGFTDLPVFIENDATAACRAELSYGAGTRLADFGYFFVGTFIGGGLVLNGSVLDGVHGNAGAFGPLPADLPGRRNGTLIDGASLYLLENDLARLGISSARMWSEPLDWADFDAAVSDWIDTAATHLARAVLTVCSVIDFPAIVVDGAFPRDVGARLVAGIEAKLAQLDHRGLIVPAVELGEVGSNARALGASSAPMASSFFLR